MRPRLGARAPHPNTNELLHSDVQTPLYNGSCRIAPRTVCTRKQPDTYPRPFAAHPPRTVAPCPLCHVTRQHVHHAVAQGECWLKRNKLSYVMDMRGKGHSGISWTAGAVYSTEEYATYEREHAAAIKVQPAVHYARRAVQSPVYGTPEVLG